MSNENLDVNETAQGYQDSVDASSLSEFVSTRGIELGEQKPKRTLMASIVKDATQVPTDIYTGIARGVNETVDTIQGVLDFLPDLSLRNEEGDLSYPRIISGVESRKRTAKSMGLEEPTRNRIPEANREDKGPLGSAVTTISQFVTGLGVLGKAMKGLGIVSSSATKGGKLLQGASKGGVADMISFDEADGRLSDALQSVPTLKPFADLLASNPDDSMLEGKLKQGIEAAGLGAAGDALFMGFKALTEPAPGSKGA